MNYDREGLIAAAKEAGASTLNYGVFITNGRFTTAARTAAKEGSPITLIDGNELVKLVIRYQLYLKPVQTYVLDEFYDSEE